MFTIHAVPGPVRSPADLAGTDAVLKELLFHHLVDRGIFLAARGFVALASVFRARRSAACVLARSRLSLMRLRTSDVSMCV